MVLEVIGMANGRNETVTYKLARDPLGDYLCRQRDWDDGADDFGCAYEAWIGGKWKEDEEAAGVMMGFEPGDAVDEAFAKKWMEEHKG